MEQDEQYALVPFKPAIESALFLLPQISPGCFFALTPLSLPGISLIIDCCFLETGSPTDSTKSEYQISQHTLGVSPQTTIIVPHKRCERFIQQ